MEHEAPHTGTPEDDLREDGAPEEAPKPEPQNRDRREPGVSECEPADDPRLRSAVGAVGSDEGLIQYFQERGAHQSREISHPPNCEGDRGEDQVEELVPEIPSLTGAEDREPVEPEREQNEKPDGDDEVRDRDHPHAQEGDSPVDSAPWSGRTPRAERRADQQR